MQNDRFTSRRGSFRLHGHGDSYTVWSDTFRYFAIEEALQITSDLEAGAGCPLCIGCLDLKLNAARGPVEHERDNDNERMNRGKHVSVHPFSIGKTRRLDQKAAAGRLRIEPPIGPHAISLACRSLCEVNFGFPAGLRV
jgi:hypothetical protein